MSATPRQGAYLLVRADEGGTVRTDQHITLLDAPDYIGQAPTTSRAEPRHREATPPAPGSATRTPPTSPATGRGSWPRGPPAPNRQHPRTRTGAAPRGASATPLAVSSSTAPPTPRSTATTRPGPRSPRPKARTPGLFVEVLTGDHALTVEQARARLADPYRRSTPARTHHAERRRRPRGSLSVPQGPRSLQGTERTTAAHSGAFLPS